LEKYPVLYGYNQELIALSNIELSKIRDPKKHLNKSVEVCNNALKVFRKENIPYLYGVVNIYLGTHILSWLQ